MKAVKRKPAPQKAPDAVAATGGVPIGWWIGAILISFFVVLEVYWPAINGPFVFDDEYLPFQTPGFVERGIGQIGLIQRPLMNLCFWINAKLFGPEPFSYHLLNVIFHFINGAMIFLALKKLL